jgi:hypothetical protein
VHLTIRVGTTAYLTTQLFFTDALDNEIISTQPVYDTRGSRDTTNSTDTVLPKSATTAANYIFDTEQIESQSDFQDVAVGDFDVGAVLFREALAQLFRQSDASMPAAGAADTDRQVALAFGSILGNQESEH